MPKYAKKVVLFRHISDCLQKVCQAIFKNPGREAEGWRRNLFRTAVRRFGITFIII